MPKQAVPAESHGQTVLLQPVCALPIFHAALCADPAVWHDSTQLGRTGIKHSAFDRIFGEQKDARRKVAQRVNAQELSIKPDEAGKIPGPLEWTNQERQESLKRVAVGQDKPAYAFWMRGDR